MQWPYATFIEDYGFIVAIESNPNHVVKMSLS